MEIDSNLFDMFFRIWTFRETPWRIHGTNGIFAYMNGGFQWQNMVNVAKYTSPVPWILWDMSNVQDQ